MTEEKKVLVPTSFLNSLRGLFFKIELEFDNIGYSDRHPLYQEVKAFVQKLEDDYLFTRGRKKV
jgi:hypothetical protein